MQNKLTWTTALLGTVLALPSVATAAPSWPGWRGPSRDGHTAGAPWPRGFTDQEQGTLKTLWRVELGASYSGPVLSEKAVFVTESTEEEEVVRALDRRNGKELWRAQWTGAMKVPFFAAKNGSWIRSTPFFDGERVYVAGMRDVLVCLEAESGRQLWRVDFTQRFQSPLPKFGFVCSPLVTDEHVYVQAGASFVKLDKLTGKTVWRVLEDGGGMSGSAFSSPVLATLQGKPQLLVQAREKLSGVDPATGGILWSRAIPAFRGMNIQTPTVYGNQIFISTYGGGSRLLEIARDGDAFKVNEVWTEPAQGYMSSPVIVDGHAYVHLRNQRLTCFDIATGKRTWTSTERYGKYMSLVSQGDLLLALDERGILYLLRTNPQKLEILDSRKVSASPTWGHLAVSGDELVLREFHAARLLRWGSEIQPVQADAPGSPASPPPSQGS